jgi:uncharacterized protein YjiS (DUF1127 family)
MRRLFVPDKGNETMTALTTSTNPAPSACTQAVAALAAVVVRAGRGLVGAWRHRNDAATLAGFDDRMLADIGLTRADLNDALGEPLWRDPTSVLARRRSERRRARRVGVLIKETSPPLVPGPDTFALPPRGTL